MYATPLLTIYFLVVIYTSAYPLSALRVWLAAMESTGLFVAGYTN